MNWLELDETSSTQDVASRLLSDPADSTDVVFAHHQVQGKGRFGRTWHSVRGDSLTMSLILRSAAGHPRPWLCGMAAAVEAAGLLKCQVRWPNDLTVSGRKLGGLLIEMKPSPVGQATPVLGIGINLTSTAVPPELALSATSLRDAGLTPLDPIALGRMLAERILGLCWPENWERLADRWSRFDDTAGKAYTTPNGEILIAKGVDGQGRLTGTVDGRQATVMAAEAYFGPEPG